MFQRLLQYVGNRILDNPFQNLRNQMGSLMVTIFSSFLVIKTETWDPEVVKALPLAQDVLDQVTPQIKLLVEEMTAKGNVENTLSSQVANVDLNDTEGSNKSKLQLRIRMFKTICEWIRHWLVLFLPLLGEKVFILILLQLRTLHVGTITRILRLVSCDMPVEKLGGR